jgi:hypothetical protein
MYIWPITVDCDLLFEGTPSSVPPSLSQGLPVAFVSTQVLSSCRYLSHSVLVFRSVAGIRPIGEAVFSSSATFFSCLVELVVSFLYLFPAARRYESLRRLAELYDRPPL